MDTAPLLLLSVVIATLCAFAANRLWHQNTTVTQENRVIENTQIFFLMLATALHARHSIRQPPRSRHVAQLCQMVLGMLCLSIMVRELDIDKFGPQPGWGVLENLIRLSGGAAWVCLLTHTYRYRSLMWQAKADVVWTSTSLLTGIGVLFYLASWFFDKSVVPLPANLSQLWEETLQMSGTVFLFTAALRPINLEAI